MTICLKVVESVDADLCKACAKVSTKVVAPQWQVVLPTTTHPAYLLTQVVTVVVGIKSSVKSTFLFCFVTKRLVDDTDIHPEGTLTQSLAQMFHCSNNTRWPNNDVLL